MEGYFDHAATTPLHPEALAEMNRLAETTFGNPSSIHGYGRKAAMELELARDVIATSLGVKSHEIIFTSGGTEGDNTALIGVAMSRKDLGRHIITTAIEHPAVLEPMHYLESQGFEVTYLPVNEQGQISLSDLEAALRKDTILVSVMYANNETGNLLPIAEIGALLKEHQAVFHTDAVQAYGKVTISPKELGIDLLSASAHKFNGPKGVGFLYKSDQVSLPAYLRGGEQEEKRRAGTENLPGIGGMAKAASLLTADAMVENGNRYRHFAKLLTEALDAAGVNWQLNGDPVNKLPHVLNLRFPGVSNDLLLMKLDLKQLAISTGSACTAGNVEPSHVLEAMYGSKSPVTKESIRVSFGFGNTAEQVQFLADSLIAILQK